MKYKIIEILEEKVQFNEGATPFIRVRDIDFDNAAQAIIDQLGLDWVSASTLPILEDGMSECVLLATKTKHGVNYSSGFYSAGGWRQYQGNSDISVPADPTHWRPLPEPPQD